MIRRGLVLVGALVVALSASVVFAPGASAKSFRIAAVMVDADLLPDASMRVVEHITYDFEGEFHNGSRPIPRGELYRITDVAVTERGAPVPFDGAPYDLAWHFTARNERRTFDISYRVLGAALVAPDVGELYWKWLGSEHPGVGVLDVTLRVPGDGAGMLAWGHGPLSGVVLPIGNSVRWHADAVPASTFVEGRVAVPSTAFTLPPEGSPRLGSILAEEQGYADAANRERERQRNRVRRINQWFLLVPLIGWACFVAVWLEWGREYQVAGVGDYVREPPDDPPAVVASLLAFGEVPAVAFSATVVDLAQRGALTIREERHDRFILADKVEWTFARNRDAASGELLPFEASVVSRLFAEGDTTSQRDLEKWARAHQHGAKEWWDSFVEQVKAEVGGRTYLEGHRALPFLLNVVVAMTVGVIGMAAIGAGSPMGVVGLVSAGVQLAATRALRRRTVAGARRTAEWKALAHFLRDFSSLGDAPIGHLALWERYLVYAVALGVSDEIARGLALRVPEPDRRGLASWYVAGGNRFDGLGGLGEFGSSFGSSMRSAFSPSSGSGGGGGFSGGGGGGGGGGGIGAS